MFQFSGNYQELLLMKIVLGCPCEVEALWIPVFWCLFAHSHPVSHGFHLYQLIQKMWQTFSDVCLNRVILFHEVLRKGKTSKSKDGHSDSYRWSNASFSFSLLCPLILLKYWSAAFAPRGTGLVVFILAILAHCVVCALLFAVWWGVRWACVSEEMWLFCGHVPKYVWGLGKLCIGLHSLKLVILGKAGPFWEPRWYLRLGSCPLM